MSQSYYLFMHFSTFKVFVLFWFDFFLDWVFLVTSTPLFKSIWYLDLGTMGLHGDGPYLYSYIFGLDALSERSQRIRHEYKQCHK